MTSQADPSYSYGYVPPSPSGNGNSWFSGIRAKLSQLTGISEWMSQLGIGNPEDNMARRSSKTPERQLSSEDTISYNSISLEDSFQSPEREFNPWDWNSCLLADLDSSHKWDDTLERQHFGPLHGLLTGVDHQGQGHDFISINLLHPTWCDKCGDFIWGILKQAVKCEKCNYTCHQRCKELVTLDCRSAGSSLASGEYGLYPKLDDGTLGTIPKELKLPPLNHTTASDSDKENGEITRENPLFSPTKYSSTLPKSFSPLPSPSTGKNTMFVQTTSGKTLKVEEVFVKDDTPFEWTPEYKEQNLAKKIEAYNQTADGMNMILSPDGQSFSGHLQVHMNFNRPISIVAGEKAPTVYDVVNTGKSSSTMTHRTITSFFLPRNTLRTININSSMTTRQMIVTLLRKFRVADNPRKFALYESSYAADEDKCTLMRKMTRIGDDVCPLKVVLAWGSAKCGNALVLQENDTGDIVWDAFEIPELENFLRILGMEEQQYMWQCKQRYNQYRYYLDSELRARGQTGIEPSAPPEEMAPGLPDNKEYNPYGTSDSMIVSDVFHTLRQAPADEEPTYMNISEIRQQQSTKL